MSTAKDAMKLAKDNKAVAVDFKFLDFLGIWQHFSTPISELEDEVFCGPSCVFTNVAFPRSEIDRRASYEHTVVRRGATIEIPRLRWKRTIAMGGSIGRWAR